MGKRGPPRTPTSILKARGSWLVNHRDGEPIPESGSPPCPRWLSKPAKQVWRQVTQQLDQMGVLAKPDGNALARYCMLWIRWRQSAEFIGKYGESYPLKDNTGAVKCFQQWPQVAVVNKLSVLLLRLEQEFGLTPAARAGIHVIVPPADHPEKRKFFTDQRTA